MQSLHLSEHRSVETPAVFLLKLTLRALRSYWAPFSTLGRHLYSAANGLSHCALSPRIWHKTAALRNVRSDTLGRGSLALLCKYPGRDRAVAFLGCGNCECWGVRNCSYLSNSKPPTRTAAAWNIKIRFKGETESFATHVSLYVQREWQRYHSLPAVRQEAINTSSEHQLEGPEGRLLLQVRKRLPVNTVLR